MLSSPEQSPPPSSSHSLWSRCLHSPPMWTARAGTVSTPGGDFPVAFEFKADGAKLTGTTMSPDGMAINIKDGKIEGDKVTFGVSLTSAAWRSISPTPAWLPRPR